MGGIFTNLPASSTFSTHKYNVTENSFTLGNWTLLVENGTVTEFNATLGRYLNGLSGKVFHIEGWEFGNSCKPLVQMRLRGDKTKAGSEGFEPST